MTKFTNAKKLNKTSIKKVPQDKPIIYRFLDSSNKELYVGIAKRNRTQDRLLEHLNIKKEKIIGATKIKIAQVSNLDSAKKIEKTLIKRLQPKFNIKDK
jgi:excinuclease UvrABC nuclease subunit